MTVTARPGSTSGGPANGATISGAGSLSLTGAAQTFTVNDLPNANDLVISTSIIDGPGAAGGISKTGAALGRMVLSGNNSYTGPVTVTTGILQAASNTALGTSAGGVNVSGANAVLELNGAAISGENVTLGTTVSQPGVFDQPVTVGGSPAPVQIASGGLRAVAGTTNSLTGNLIVGSGATANTFGMTVGNNGSLDISGSVSGTAANSLFKQGTGQLIYSGATPNSLSGTTFVQEGTLTLNKRGTAQAIVGPLVVGDSRGGADADKVTIGNLGGAVAGPTQGLDQIANAASVTVLSSGKLDLSSAQAYGSEIQLLTFPSGTTDGSPFTLSLLSKSINFNYSTTLGTGPGTTIGNLQLALDTAFGSGNVQVSAVDGANNNQSFLLKFAGQLSNANVPAVQVTSGTASVNTLRDGAGNAIRR